MESGHYVRTTVCTILLALAGAGNARAQSAMPPVDTADRLFAQCRDAWSRARLPRSLRYVVDISARTDRDIDERYAGIMGSTPDDYRVARFSERELEAPARPTGINAYVSLLGTNVVKLNHDREHASILGSPQLSPRFSFGLARRAVADSPDVAPSSLPVIGTVAAASRTYAVRLIAMENADGRTIAHLGFRPLRDPRVDRLRELWVDGDTHEPVRAIVAGNFTDGPSLGVDWSIAYRTVAGVTYIATETALAPLAFSRTERYENVVVSFVDLEPSAEPAPPLATMHALRSENDLREPD